MKELVKRKVGQSDQRLSGPSLDAVKASIDADSVREGYALNSQMVLLTIAIAGGPFLGLLGTVVGVMITFASIAAAGDVNVNAIAPGIAAALLATVAGLSVAIPSLFGYNYLASRIKTISSDMQIFIDEFVTRVAELTGRRDVCRSAGSQSALRRHQHHADVGSGLCAARHLHHPDDRRRARRARAFAAHPGRQQPRPPADPGRHGDRRWVHLFGRLSREHGSTALEPRAVQGRESQSSGGAEGRSRYHTKPSWTFWNWPRAWISPRSAWSPSAPCRDPPTAMQVNTIPSPTTPSTSRRCWIWPMCCWSSSSS